MAIPHYAAIFFAGSRNLQTVPVDYVMIWPQRFGGFDRVRRATPAALTGVRGLPTRACALPMANVTPPSCVQSIEAEAPNKIAVAKSNARLVLAVVIILTSHLFPEDGFRKNATQFWKSKQSNSLGAGYNATPPLRKRQADRSGYQLQQYRNPYRRPRLGVLDHLTGISKVTLSIGLPSPSFDRTGVRFGQSLAEVGRSLRNIGQGAAGNDR